MFCLSYSYSNAQLEPKYIYQSENKTQELVLYNSEYEYYYKFGMHQSACSRGTWKKNGNSILLISKYMDLPLVVNTNIVNKAKGAITFNLIVDSSNCGFSKESREIKFLFIVDGEDTLRMQNNSITMKSIPTFFQLMVEYSDSTISPIPLVTCLYTDKYFIKDRIANSFDIKVSISKEAFYFLPIKYITLKVKRNKIIWIRPNFDNTFINEKEVFYKIPISNANLIKLRQCKCNLVNEP